MKTTRRIPHLLVVEDNPLDVAMLRRALRAHAIECELTVADDGEKAIAYLAKWGKQNGPDLVIVDINLPKQDGLAVLRNYRFSPSMSDAKFVVLTSSNSPGDRLRAQIIGIDAYVRKPIELADFLAIGALIRGLLELPPEPREIPTAKAS